MKQNTLDEVFFLLFNPRVYIVHYKKIEFATAVNKLNLIIASRVQCGQLHDNISDYDATDIVRNIILLL